MIVKNVKRKLELPHEEGQFIEIRQLSYRELEEARESRREKVITRAAQMGPEMMANLPSTDREDIKKAIEDPLNEFDIDVLLEKGIVSWSYPEKVSKENIWLLDEETAQFVALELVPKKRPEAETKKG